MCANAAAMFGIVDGPALTSTLDAKACASFYKYQRAKRRLSKASKAKRVRMLECQAAKKSWQRCLSKEASATLAEFKRKPIVKEERGEDSECGNHFDKAPANSDSHLVQAPAALKPSKPSGLAAMSHRLSHRIVIPCSDLRFSQKSISGCFRSGSSLSQLITELAANPDHVHCIGPLRIFKAGKNYVTLDNRRLACLLESSRLLSRTLMVPCTLYSKRFILACFSELQGSKLRFYFESSHRGSFVHIRRSSGHKHLRRVIRVLKKDALTPQCTNVFKEVHTLFCFGKTIFWWKTVRGKP